ncbi:MAG: FHIPEP family type III secretion protein, partial [Candidatus Xenobia bacterium]
MGARIAPAALAAPRFPQDSGKLIAKEIWMARITVELGKELLALLESSSKKGLLRLAESIPAQIKEELGFRCPHVRFHYDQHREGAAYAIHLEDHEVASGHLHIGRLLALGTEEQLVKLTGIPAMEPIYGTPGLWIEARSKDIAEKAGCVVVEPARVLAATLTEAIRAHAAEIVGASELQQLLEDYRKNQGEGYHSLVPEKLSEEEVHAILRRLLRERVPIANLELIFQALLKHAAPGRRVPWLTEKVRQAMGARLWGPLAAPDGRIPVFTLEAAFEDALEALLAITEGEPQLSLGPSLRARTLELLGTGVQHMLRLGRYPVLLCKATLRRAVKRLAEAQYPHLIVLSMEETPSNRVNNMETLSLRLTPADRLRVLTGRLARWWGGENAPGFPEPGSGTPKRSDGSTTQLNSEEPQSMESDNEFPADSNGTGRGAEEPQLPAADEETEVEPEMAAAMVLSGNFTKALTDRVMAALSHEEMMRLASGLVRLKHIPESRLEKLWNKLASMYAWDWRDEDDLIEFI